jgi:hypothetical protein
MAGFIPYSEMIAGQSLTGDYAAKQIIPEGLPEIANKITL